MPFGVRPVEWQLTTFISELLPASPAGQWYSRSSVRPSGASALVAFSLSVLARYDGSWFGR